MMCRQIGGATKCGSWQANPAAPALAESAQPLDPPFRDLLCGERIIEASVTGVRVSPSATGVDWLLGRFYCAKPVRRIRGQSGIGGHAVQHHIQVQL